MARTLLTRAQRRIVGVVAAGAVLLAAIGFAGSYAAVRHLAEQRGFGSFAVVFPVGIDAGIGVLLALDLLLTWLRIPYAVLRPAAWVLTMATVAFNAAASWPDPIAVGMHAVIPVLFVAVVEAARHAVGRIADITVERHIEPVRLARWLLAPVSTFRLWRRMKLWELRSYDAALEMQRQQLVQRAQLRAQYGRAWRRKAPVDQLLHLRLARFGRPLQPRNTGAPTFDQAATEAVAVAASEPPAPVAPPVLRRAVAADATPPRIAVHETVAPPADAVAEPEAPDSEPAATPEAPQASEVQHLTVADVAALLHVTPATVRSYVRRRHLTPVGQDGRGRNLFEPAAVAAFQKDTD